VKEMALVLAFFLWKARKTVGSVRLVMEMSLLLLPEPESVLVLELQQVPESWNFCLQTDLRTAHLERRIG